MNNTDRLVLAFAGSLATLFLIVVALVTNDIGQINDTQEFVNIVSDTREENEANIQNYINNNLK